MITALYLDLSRPNPYQALGCDCWDVVRDATLYAGPWPVVAHPPCGPWSRLKAFCGDELLAQKHLAPLAVEQVRRWGGVLEHPAGSELWSHARLPLPGGLPDAYGGFTLAVEQWRWGHRAIKPTWLYIVGVNPAHIPAIPDPACERPAGSSARTVGGAKAGGQRSMLERLPKSQRHLTPPDFAAWLVQVAALVRANF